MALRNLAIALFFTVGAGILLEATIPLLAVVAGAFAIAAYTADWSAPLDIELDSPFTLRYALGVGAIFLVVLLAGGFAEDVLGTTGLYAAALLSGLISSAGATASAVVLYSNGQITAAEATLAILLATAASIGVKAGITAFSPNRSFARGVILWSAALLVGASAVAGVVLSI